MAGIKTYLVEVSPLSKSRLHSTLSYFSTSKIAPGTIVKVPLGRSEAKALVLNCRSALSAKSDLRKATFSLKKIKKSDISEIVLSGEFLRAAIETAHYYAVSVGTLLSILLPKTVLELNFSDRFKKFDAKEILLLQMESEERFGQYRALVRQSFARGKSAMFIAPTHLDALRAKNFLSQGIEEFVYLFTLQAKKSEIKKNWLKALKEKHPILFITTPSGIAFDRPDLETLILERENSRAYRTMAPPFINFKTFLEKLSKYKGLQLVLGDSILSLETLWREKQGEFGESSLIRWRLPAAPAQLIDSRGKQDKDGKFEIFSPELKDLIKKALEEKEKVFLFGPRKGLAPTTLCSDCGTVLPCLNCGAGVVLHRHEGVTIYICHACGTKRDSTTTCSICGSWKLVPLGIGTERIENEVKILFPRTNVAVLDKDHASTDTQARNIIKEFYEEGQILVGTELVFFHLEKIPYSGLVSIDSLFSIPDFNINERIFYLVSRLREMTLRESVIQTRNIGKQILAWSTFGNIIDFYQEEIRDRENFLYPPFTIFIKITGPVDLRERFAKWEPQLFKDSLIIRVERQKWPNEELIHEISLLGPEFSIKVDPESIL